MKQEFDFPPRLAEQAPDAFEKAFRLRIPIETLPPAGDGGHLQWTQARDRAQQAEVDKANYIASRDKLRLPIDPAEIARFDQLIHATKAAADFLAAGQAEALRQPARELAIFRQVRAFMFKHPNVEQIDVPSGRATPASLAKLRADRQAVHDAPEPLAAAIARAEQAIDRLAAAPLARLRPNRSGRLEIGLSCPQLAGDGEKLAVWAASETIKAKLRADIEALYADVGKTYSDAERKAELKRFDALIDSAERQIAEQIWQDWDGQSLLPFEGLSPAAVLSVKVVK
jgi:hypothetical protein